MEIVPSGRKHGISDDDIRHGVANAIASISSDEQPDFTMVIGPDRSGRLLEIGVFAAEDNDYVIHAMPARAKYLKLIESKRGDRP